MEAEGFDVLWKDASCLVVNKPAGLLTQAPPGIDSLEIRIKHSLAQLPDRHETANQVYLGVPHRLDRHVSGAMVFATRKKTARAISQQFERREIRKTYWAAVEGVVSSVGVSPGESEFETWTDYIKKVPGEARAIISNADDSDAKQAVLHFRRLAVIDDQPTSGSVSLLEIQLETGRMHQIRIQAASRGYPVLGDRLYGSSELFGPQTDDPRLRHIGLHARKIGFSHPKTDEPIDIVAPLPATWDSISMPELG